MKRKILICSLSILFVAFVGFHANAQSEKKTEKDPNSPNYTGIMSEKDLRSGYTKRWFNAGYKHYKPSKEILKGIKDNINNYRIKVFMGTWCPDSRRELPKLYKLLDDANYNEDHLKVYAVNHGMATAENFEKGLNITHVPTVIFYDDQGNEVNRFVEYPQETFEKDIYKIVNNKPYKNSYAN